MHETERTVTREHMTDGRLADVPTVIGLEAAASYDVGVLGGKAASLARLLGHGVAVPPGFVVTTAAFRAFARQHGLDAALAGSSSALADREQAAQVLATAAFPDSLRAALEAALRSLDARTGGLSVAVRSSAIDEDSADASFAGQYETVLGVRGAPAVLDAVRRCWASLLRPEALRYRAEHGQSGDGTQAMAVVVQAMVGAQASGVAFTRHPVVGDASVVVIDLVAGLGDALVSGTKTPDHYVLAKADLSIARREPAGAHPLLSDARVRDIAKLAISIERSLGAPLDIEWALGDGAIWALQARPITTAVAGASTEPGELDTRSSPTTQWTSTNVQEVLPGLLTPLTRSMVLRDFDAYSRAAMKRLGITPQTTEPIVGSFFGRAFMNLSLAQEIGGQTASSEKHYFGTEEEARKAQGGGNALAKLRLALAMPKTITCLARLGTTMQRIDALAAEPLDETSLDALGARIAEHGAAHVLVSIYSGAMFTILGKLTAAWLGDQSGELHGRLLRGLAGMDSARPAYELWELAALAGRSETLRRIVADADATALASSDDDAFRSKLDAFLRQHGHHSVQEMELAARTWDEDLTTVLAMIRNYLDGDPERCPDAIEARARTDREAATDEALARLSAWQRPLFRYFLGAAQRWVPLREHSKSLLIQAMHRRRRHLRRLAERLVARGLLGDAWDIYYLSHEELAALDAGGLGRAEAEITIRRRRREERQHRLLELPETFSGRPVPVAAEATTVPEGHTLTGIGVSRGTVTGRARVVLDPRADTVIHPGEILVAPITDAGWAPLFTVAAGIVVDIGGALSHGSTVAREYGLPAVVNVRIATRTIRTGDTITVDGTRGVVTLADGRRPT